MRTKADLAADIFSNGFNCAQSVLSVFCEDYGLDAATARKMTSGLGMGAKMGALCGAVSGAILVIGLKCGQGAAADKDAKADCYSRVAAFTALFQSKYGSCACKELLGVDLCVPEEYERAKATGLFDTTCTELVKHAVTLLEEQGY